MTGKDTFCGYCGFSFEKHQVKYPKTCSNCENIVYHNPIPIVVTVIFTLVSSEEQLAVLLVKRNNEPQKDCWAFPGGFLECGETWQQGSAREIFEETGIIINPDDLLIHKITTASNSNLIIFNTCWLFDLDISKFVPNSEVSELKLITKFEDLAFPAHTEILEILLKDQVNG